MLGRRGGGSETLGGEEEDFNSGGRGELETWRGPGGLGRWGKGEVVESLDENLLLSETGAVDDRDERSDR